MKIQNANHSACQAKGGTAGIGEGRGGGAEAKQLLLRRSSPTHTPVPLPSALRHTYPS